MNSNNLSPHATSTPKNFDKKYNVKSRPGISDYNCQDDIISPVLPPRKRSNTKINSSDNSDVSDDSSGNDSNAEDRRQVRKTSLSPDVCKEPPRVPLKQHTSFTMPKYIIIVVVTIFAVILRFHFSTGVNSNKSTDLLQKLPKQFPTITPNFWFILKSGVEDVKNWERPATFVLLYETKSNMLVEKIINEIVEYSLRSINIFGDQPIIVESDEFNKSEYLSDYGKLIAKYKNLLIERGVMVVKNIEKIPGQTAQVFHSFCDEHNPLVSNAVFFLTMEVDKLPSEANAKKYFENHLRQQWSDIRDDIFYPLITRISSNVVALESK